LIVVPDIYDDWVALAPADKVDRWFPDFELHGHPNFFFPAFGLAVQRIIDIVVASVGSSCGLCCICMLFEFGWDPVAGFLFRRCALERRGKIPLPQSRTMSTMPTPKERCAR